MFTTARWTSCDIFPFAIAALETADLTAALGKVRAHQLLAEISHQYAGEKLKPTVLRMNFSNGLPPGRCVLDGTTGKWSPLADPGKSVAFGDDPGDLLWKR